MAIEEPFKIDNSGSQGKPFMADRYCQKILAHKDDSGFNSVPVIEYMTKISA
ncbi:MAG: hypothetical protein ACYCPS_00450 [Candidatus Saccharimonadales bacterium]